MSNKLGFKLFLSFLLFSALLLSAAFFLVLKEVSSKQEDLYLELLAERMIARTASFEAELLQQETQPSNFQGLIKTEVGFELLAEKDFNFDSIKSSIPPSGTSLFPCRDKNNQKHWCALSSTSLAGFWLFESISQKDLQFVLNDLIHSFWPILAILLVFSLLASMALTKVLLSPYIDRQVRRREKELQRKSLLLMQNEKLASLGQLGASIAHEIKNPLTAMKGYAGFLQKRVSDDPELKEAARIIRDESERCSSILQQILRYSRSSNSDKKAFSSTELLKSLYLLVKSEARQRQLSVEIEEEQDFVGYGQAQQIQQVLLNLILNAFQVSQAGQVVRLRSQKLDENYFLFEVEDNGPGIPEDLQTHIFEAFFSTKGPEESSGLGLSIAKQIVESQGGELKLARSTSNGSVFQVSLPLASEGKKDEISSSNH